MIILENMTTREISSTELPLYFRHSPSNTYVKFWDVKECSNPYFAIEEKQCANHVCRILLPDRVIYTSCVIRDDGTVWQVDFRNFQNIELRNVK